VVLSHQTGVRIPVALLNSILANSNIIHNMAKSRGQSSRKY
jgi:hypothetical protein